MPHQENANITMDKAKGDDRASPRRISPGKPELESAHLRRECAVASSGDPVCISRKEGGKCNIRKSSPVLFFYITVWERRSAATAMERGREIEWSDEPGKRNRLQQSGHTNSVRPSGAISGRRFPDTIGIEKGRQKNRELRFFPISRIFQSPIRP